MGADEEAMGVGASKGLARTQNQSRVKGRLNIYKYISTHVATEPTRGDLVFEEQRKQRMQKVEVAAALL